MSRCFPLYKLGLERKYESLTKAANISFSELSKTKKVFNHFYLDCLLELTNEEAPAVLCSVVKPIEHKRREMKAFLSAL